MFTENISAAIIFFFDIYTHTDATLHYTAKMKNVLAILLGYLKYYFSTSLFNIKTIIANHIQIVAYD